MADALTALPEVAVVCCFLEGEQFLAEAIESVLGQTYRQLSLVLVDDGSTGEATAIARRYADSDPRVRYLDHAGHANLGLSASRNAGVAATTAPFVAFIDADDVWLPEKLAEQMAIAGAHPELGMVSGAALHWRSWQGGRDAIMYSGASRDTVVLPPRALLEVYPLGAATAPPPSDLLLRREAFRRVGGFEAQFRGERALYEDQAFLTRLYLESPVWFSSRTWLLYRQHETSIVASVKAAGRYDAVRLYFLNWFQSYLAGRPGVDWRIRAKLNLALLTYRIPGLLPLSRWTLPRRVTRRLRRMFLGPQPAIMTVLDDPIVNPVASARRSAQP